MGGAHTFALVIFFPKKYLVGKEEQLHDNILNVYINFAALRTRSFEKFT